MKKQFLILIVLLSSICSNAQNYFFERDQKDTTRWRAGSVSVNRDGSFTTEFSPLLSQDSAILILVNIKYNKFKVIENINNELSRIDSTLKKYTGKVYDDYVKESISNSLAGAWELVDGSDTLSLNVDNKLKVTGGKIKGSLKLDKSGLLLTGYQKEPVLLTQKEKYFTNGKIKFYKL
jgi:hypothetical protein